LKKEDGTMWIFYVNYPNNKRAKINILLIENRKIMEVDKWGPQRISDFMKHLFGGAWILKIFIGFKLEENSLILHLRGDRSDIDYILGELTRNDLSEKFSIRHRSWTVHGINYLKRCPNYEKRCAYVNGDVAYQKVLSKTIPMTPERRKK
jgi:hypothetical protein